ncbi:MAG: alcohol dehydrogenase catalytic domain-containing protein [bacterium]
MQSIHAKNQQPRMQTLCKCKPKPGLNLCHKDIPIPKSNEVLIKVLKTGICGTDLSLYNYTPWAKSVLSLPQTIGHEFVGKIVKIGSKVTTQKTNNIVSAEAHLFCKKCDQCANKNYHLCPNTKGLGIHTNGAMAEFVCVPESNLWACPHIDPKIMAFADALGNALYATSRTDIYNQDILITGAGPIGLATMMLCLFLKANSVTIIEPNTYRQKLAKKLGATQIASPKTRLKKPKKGWNIGFEMSGKTSALEKLVKNLNPGSQIIIMGILPNQSQINWPSLIFKNLNIHCLYGREIFKTWQQLDHYLSQGFNPLPLVTHEFAAKDYQKAFSLMASGNCGKILLNWN